MVPCNYVLVGDETGDNLRLSQILKQAFGKANVARFLELRHLEPFLSDHQDSAIVICLDLFSLDLMEATATIGRVRTTFPKAVFNLYLDPNEYQRRINEIPAEWQERFLHYFKTYKEGPEVEYEPIVRASMRPSRNEAIYNMTHEPVRLTPAFQKGVMGSDPSGGPNLAAPTAFVSYSRADWPNFVAGLVAELTTGSYRVWVDQNYIAGGDDWMDAIGEALQVCDTLLLVLSPDALNSRYVKMEYRYFFRQEKPIIPIIYRQVGRMPFELASLHYIDFTQGDRAKAYSTLVDILSRRRAEQGAAPATGLR
jgi:hypothetical protein